LPRAVSTLKGFFAGDRWDVRAGDQPMRPDSFHLMYLFADLRRAFLPIILGFVAVLLERE
jgi:hypothetical protein